MQGLIWVLDKGGAKSVPPLLPPGSTNEVMILKGQFRSQEYKVTTPVQSPDTLVRWRRVFCVDIIIVKLIRLYV